MTIRPRTAQCQSILCSTNAYIIYNKRLIEFFVSNGTKKERFIKIVNAGFCRGYI